ncbi:class I SAM-dependent methyltransferase [Mesorhizobium sp.]|uniref:class I SAM-dependent methyltransferase n=1 Tax=Mesorhizobium sp. TaxID=1871066 RepID=UPI000FE95C43|nr:class I SAM-dependent methyltransferase [Mesorhizobium sp.]RWD68526.1 MAG: class I SAM-dependent methyltransferase [Mesorhizobium sp.]TIV57802.1 MAG: class I SAM-dependent methyltransferase [Mesorhizobium sp.]
MTERTKPSYDGAILSFQQKRGQESCAFVLPFLRPDMRLLDIGCGPGTVTATLAAHVGEAVGVDIQPRSIAAAKESAVEAGIGNLSFLEADMIALPFDDLAFDAVFFHAVLYHQDATTLARTLAEARRVLRPGGLVATRDADVGGNILDPDLPGLRLALDLWQRWYEHGEPDALHFGRRQGAVFRTHGFEPIWTGASYVNHSADAETRRETVDDARRSLNSLGPKLIEKGQATEAELEEALMSWGVWENDPDAVYLRCRCECVARKPDAA